MINRIGKMCVAAMSLCMIVLIDSRKRGDSRYYFPLWQTNNNTPNKLLLSESAVSCPLRVRSVSFTSRAKGCIKFVPHSCLVSLSHKVGVFLEEWTWCTSMKECQGIFYRWIILNEVETSHHLILIRLYFILTILITEDDHNHIVFDWIKIIAV
jgi:hypothetical protein